jgi:glycosyltransferase involved in cell wall biosynthesis/carbonic anhydrase/acetyltransferase-like protein (isoleucine patch superfamily)
MLCGRLNPRRDGVAAYTLRLAEQLKAVDVDPVLLTSYHCADAHPTSIGVTRRWTLPGIASAAQALRELNLDVVHVQYAPSLYGFSRAVGLLPALLPRSLPLVVTLHEYGVWPNGYASWSSPLWSAAERRSVLDREALLLLPRADAVFVASAEHLEVLGRRFPGLEPRARVVPIGLNLILPPADRAADRAAVRRELGASADAPIVAFFGFLHPVKALDQLIEATAALRDTWPDVHLLLLGGAQSHSVDAAAARRIVDDLRRVARDYTMTSQVHLTGYLPDAEVGRLLGAADVAAFPFSSGVTSKSGSLLTAFAAELPVVATAPPGQLREPLEEPGVLRVPPDDTEALSAALRRVLNNPALAYRLRRGGRTVAGVHSWDAIAAAHAETYGSVVTRPSGGSPVASTRGLAGWRRTGVNGETGVGTERVRPRLRRVLAGLRDRLPDPDRPPGARPTEDPALFKQLIYGDPARLHIASTAVLNNALFNLSSGEITVGEYAFFGHNVSVLTGTHDWTKFGAERQVAVPTSGRDVVIEEGAWISSNAIIVAPCRIGAHAVVGVGSLVLKDVAPYTIVAGNPARVLRTIPRPEDSSAERTDPEAGAGAVAAG